MDSSQKTFKGVNAMSDEVKNIFKGFGLLGLIILAVALLIFVGSFFIGVSADTNAGGGCIGVVFDKAIVMGADKIVVYDGDEVITITDKEDVREIASEFVVANRAGLCGYRSGERMEIYNGSKLVRSIHWNECCELADIYEVDATHWAFPSMSKIGQVELSRDALARVNRIINEHRDGV